MDRFTLVASHLSSVFASSTHVTTHAVPTARRDLPLATVNSDIPDIHASHSSLFHSTAIGDVLIRVVQGGLAVELVSLSTNVSPVRFVFPAAVVPSPSLVSWKDQVHLIVLTSVGILFRIILPVHEDWQLWHEPLRKDWCREWHVKKVNGMIAKVLHVQDSHIVMIGLPGGGFLRLESDFDDNATYSEQWTEVEYKTNNWYSALFPSLSTSHDHPSEIVSFATVPTPTDVADVFTLSRDRVLRRWTPSKGLRAEQHLHIGNGDSEQSLLDSYPQRLLRVDSFPLPSKGKRDREEKVTEKLHVLVFFPTFASPASAGQFQMYETEPDYFNWNLVGSCEASGGSVGSKLQDFIYAEDKLYVLWERQGQGLLEIAHFSPGVYGSEWTTSSVGRSGDLPQEAVNELLLQPGSLTDKFLGAILRPGVFSSLTLRAALQDYKEHYLSLPGPHPAPLVASYATLSESIAAVVGCTVELKRDSQTGVALYEQYGNALRRDWEGFLARCREIERSARWPLALGIGGTKRQVLVLERERISQCVDEDTPQRLHRLLSNSIALDPHYSLLSTCWALRSKISIQLARRIEAETLNIVKQEFAFPLADIIAEASNKAFSHDDIDDDFDEWLTERLTPIHNMDEAIRDVLEAISFLDNSVKQEEDEVELIIPPSTTELSRALVATYITESVYARYDFCCALSVLLFALGEELKKYDPGLLAEVFALIRGISTLRYLCQQPAGDLEGSRPVTHESVSADDVVARLSSLHVSRGGRNPHPSYSLVHQLLTESGQSSLVPTAAHYFLLQSGIFGLLSPAHATRSEVFLCERLRLMGYREAARHLLAWLPRTPAVCYVLGRLWIDSGRGDEAIVLLQGVAGCFGTEFSLSNDDLEAFSSVLPTGTLFASECEYFLHVAELFRSTGFTSHEVFFTKLAISVWPFGEEFNELSVTAWATLVKGYADLGLYEDAYNALIESPHHDQKHQYVSHLVYKMCEDDALDRLLSMNFRGLVQEVELSLSFKARNADPRSRPNWSQILYTWHTTRGEYRNAALVMYNRSKKLLDLQEDAGSSVDLAEQQLEALTIAMNALSLLGDKNAYIIVPSPATGLPRRKKRKLDNYIPEHRFTAGQRKVDIVNMTDIEQEYIHLTANLELIRRDPTLMRNGEPPLSPWVTVSKLTQAGLYDIAMQTAKALSIDMVELFQRVALQCLRLTASGETSLIEVTASDWLLTDKVSSWPGTPAERGWRYLRQSLERYDNAETDFSYSKAVFETLLSHNPSSPPPPWLVQNIEEHHPEYLIRTCMRYGNLEEALQHTLNLVRKSTSSWGQFSSTQSSSTWLPYALIDAVLKTTEENISPQAQQIRGKLQAEVSNRIIRLQKHYERASTSH